MGFYKEVKKLNKMLDDANIPHVFRKLYDGHQVIYPEDGENRIADAIEHSFSYGSKKDLLELMGLLTDEELEIDSVVGSLTAEDVFNRIRKHYEGEFKTMNENGELIK